MRLTCQGTREDLARQGIELREGIVPALYTDDADDEGRPDELRAEGYVQYAEDEQCWVAAVDWSALHHASEEATQTNGGAAENRGEFKRVKE